MFLFSRLFRRSGPLGRLIISLIVVGGGIALVVFGVVDHNTVILVRGAILLGLVVVIGGGSVWRSRVTGGGGPGRY
ncbi:MAG: hypothetical protein ACREOL_04400 [Candidatus Dormibacteria bacterium]